MKTRGFTLIELLISVAIIGLLATIALPLSELAIQRGKEQELRMALRDIRIALDAYKRAADEGRVARSAEQSGYPPDFSALVQGVPDARSPGGVMIYFLRRLPRDPFYPDPATPAEQSWGVRSYQSPPDAPQRGKDIFDVYSLQQGVGLNGIEYKLW